MSVAGGHVPPLPLTPYTLQSLLHIGPAFVLAKAHALVEGQGAFVLALYAKLDHRHEPAQVLDAYEQEPPSYAPAPVGGHHPQGVDVTYGDTEPFLLAGVYAREAEPGDLLAVEGEEQPLGPEVLLLAEVC